MKRQVNINKKAFIAALCASALFGTLISSNTYADEYDDMRNWMTNTGFNDISLFDCILWEYEYANNTSIEEIYNEIGPNGALPQTGLDNIEMAYCQNYSISDITGLEKLHNLKLLDLSYNQLRSIDLSKNTNLLGLDLSYNYLSSIDLSANRKLKVLEIANNLLNDANLYYNTNLIALDIENNNLTKLDVSNSPMLSVINTEDIELITSARAKKNGGLYTLKFSMPYYISRNTSLYDIDDPILIDPSDGPISAYSTVPRRWNPASSSNYFYDTNSESYIIQNRNNLKSGLQLEMPLPDIGDGGDESGGGGAVANMSSQANSRAATPISVITPSTISINARPVTIRPSLVVNGTPYEISDTTNLSTKYIGEEWDSNDYREIVDQTLIENHQENVKLVKVEIYNSLKSAPSIDTGLDSKSTSLHLLGTIPDIEVPMDNVMYKELNPDDDDEPINAGVRSSSPVSPYDKYNYNPEVILTKGTPDFRIIYYFETIKPEANVPDTGFNTRWEGSETTNATPIATIIAFASLAVASVLHIIKCQAHKVRFKKY